MLGEIISREHSYMVRLLVVLDKLLADLKAEKSIDYNVIAEVIHYLQQHSEQTHHPKEDIIYHYYLEHYGNDEQIANLEQAHHELAQVSQEFAELVEMVNQDAVVPHDVFYQALANFIHQQKKHLDFEEREILPQLKKMFTDQDWQQVESLWGEADKDPLFGADIEQDYAKLVALI
ncbi:MULTISPECIES: hemerythrin domain-containing protein [Vibrio]|uniref:Hemerythrin domain-containing protein n=1 Tax=Vibrio algicola TaxID=2662262 RepID=A0A5Q0TKE2_9VIBR|nr:MULTISPECIES: hemerythrin domain-containing protein [Vibrio]MBD1575327.1 hemerythrin domain-containing protein [Vibrio sp. S11_S32]